MRNRQNLPIALPKVQGSGTANSFANIACALLVGVWEQYNGFLQASSKPKNKNQDGCRNATILIVEH